MSLFDLRAYLVDPEDPGLLWLATKAGLFQFRPALHQPRNATTPTLIRRVIALGADRVVHGGVRAHGDPTAVILPPDAGGVRFEVAVPHFSELPFDRFQFHLEDFEEDWTPWSKDRAKEYTNLPPGRYVFRARGGNRAGAVAAADRIELVVSGKK